MQSEKGGVVLLIETDLRVYPLIIITTATKMGIKYIIIKIISFAYGYQTKHIYTHRYKFVRMYISNGQ